VIGYRRDRPRAALLQSGCCLQRFDDDGGGVADAATWCAAEGLPGFCPVEALAAILPPKPAGSSASQTLFS